MNPELQKELLAILREMKTGAPGAWQALVEQRSVYCWMIAGMCFAIAVAVGFIARAALKASARVRDDTDRAFGTALSWAILLGAFIPLGIAAQNVAEAIAPLGCVLEAIR